jgi:hypothetical protein
MGCLVIPLARKQNPSPTLVKTPARREFLTAARSIIRCAERGGKQPRGFLCLFCTHAGDKSERVRSLANTKPLACKPYHAVATSCKPGRLSPPLLRARRRQEREGASPGLPSAPSLKFLSRRVSNLPAARRPLPPLCVRRRQEVGAAQIGFPVTCELHLSYICTCDF